jgi:hypothetical protein
MASEIIVNTIKAPTTGANANKVIIPSGVTLDASGGELTTPAGHIIQVVEATTATNYGNITSTSFVEVSPDLRCTITPKFANSKLLVMFHSMMYKNNGSNPWGVATIFRDGTDIFGGTYGAGYTQVVGANSSMIHNARKIVTANNTNATTFSLYVKAGSPYIMAMDNADRQVMVMEIAQ